jgi:small subunit ribosomal protein S8
MTMTDPIADMLTRIRNALLIRREDVTMPTSKMKQNIADALKREGFIEGYEVEPGAVQGVLRVRLKYGPDGEQVIRTVERDSKPGRRMYVPASDIGRVLNGIGAAIYSTPQGVLSDRECRERHVGGERLATVY